MKKNGSTLTEMKQNSILVTGGTGFFGCSLLDMITRGNWKEYRFTMLSRRAQEFSRLHPEYAALSNVEFLSADVRELAGCDRQFQYIIHAATPAVDSPDDAELHDIIVSGTKTVLDFARGSGAEKLLYISSGGVYGAGTQPFKETDICTPLTVYGKAKLEAENLVLTSDIPAVIMRAFAFAGKHLRRDVHFAFGNFLADALAGRDIIIKGDGTPLRSYMHSDDLAMWLMTMLLSGRNGTIYNCGSDHAVSIKILAEKINSVLNPTGKITVSTPAVSGTRPSCYVPDIARAKLELNLNLTIDLETAIKLSVG